MSYHITSTLKGQTVAIEQYSDILFESAKDHARTMVESKLADRVEIRNDDGKLVFHYPRVVHA